MSSMTAMQPYYIARTCVCMLCVHHLWPAIKQTITSLSVVDYTWVSQRQKICGDESSWYMSFKPTFFFASQSCRHRSLAHDCLPIWSSALWRVTKSLSILKSAASPTLYNVQLGQAPLLTSPDKKQSLEFLFFPFQGLGVMAQCGNEGGCVTPPPHATSPHRI